MKHFSIGHNQTASVILCYFTNFIFDCNRSETLNCLICDYAETETRRNDWVTLAAEDESAELVQTQLTVHRPISQQ